MNKYNHNETVMFADVTREQNHNKVEEYEVQGNNVGLFVVDGCFDSRS